MLLERAGQSLRGAVSFNRLSEQARSIHIPGRIISCPTNLAHCTRTLFSQITTQLRGKGVPLSRFTHSSPSIRQSLSLPARIALSRPLRAPSLPRVPRVPGNVTQVGLGTARNFSTSRPIFQNLVQNVPVAGRSFYEVGWDVKLRKEKNSKIRRPKNTHRKAKVADKLILSPEPISSSASMSYDEEVRHYFGAPARQLVTTYLQIPLAPTPTSRVRLPSSPSPRLLPLPALAKEHASHSKHAIRVSSLFRRLDAARVWERGVSCETFGDPSGLCTILRLEFEGWTEDMVRDVLGDAGKDWCTIQEVRLAPQAGSGHQALELSPLIEAASSKPSSEISLVMPTVDVSSCLATASSPPLSWSSAPSSPRSSDGSGYSLPSVPESVLGEDGIPDTSSHDPPPSTADEWASVTRSSPNPSWLGFSSDFARRASHHEGTIF
ncbi:hypothetical protein JB92DRAFT_2912991 [Gautieria morchelliformis]|nr:hypothetical protein JB92DRAFT_2912991 [Gautieria morchelliformis]